VYHGVLAPYSSLRAQVTPAGRGKKTGITERHRVMTWAQRLKRVFRIDMERSERCAGKVRIVARVEDPQLIGKILAHLQEREGVRAVPVDDLTAR
jgi:hypothetical protein